ncbi:MAG: hypothetical protein QOJ29_2420, partial [Thermoleophilaceae bacterium]|nr:hypothetical protein [Thermoleophilaceae bacterium]
IYDMILDKHRAGGGPIPVPPEQQSSCFQEYCNKRLFYLSRQRDNLNLYALGFAAASYELLVRSWRERDPDKPWKDRQYSSLYVRLPEGSDEGPMLEQITKLVDAAVFVLEPGPESPRAKAKERNPLTQFVLGYRKLFGLSNFIGLAERDRFELNAKDLKEWLSHPERSKEILLRSLGGGLEVERNPDSAHNGEAALFEEGALLTTAAVLDPTDLPLFEQPADCARKRSNLVEATLIPMHPANKLPVGCLVAGLGFEERTPASLVRLLDAVEPQAIVLVRYDEPGYGKDMETLAKMSAPAVEVVHHRELAQGQAPLYPSDLPSLVDVTGLAKDALFSSVRTLLRFGPLLVAHTQAESHHPLDDDIARVFAAERGQDPHELLRALGEVWPGEHAPWIVRQLLPQQTYDSRQLVLAAAAAPKAERLLNLVESRDFDMLALAIPSKGNPRSDLARVAARIVGADPYLSAEIPSDGLAQNLEHLASVMDRAYVQQGLNVELGVTGSKMHAVACAAISLVYKVGQCWYVTPSRYDPARFSSGIGATTVHQLNLRRRVSADDGPGARESGPTQ